MLPAAHAFFHQLIDYAGLFPPAKLPLEEAWPRYVEYRQASPHAWILGRFVCPTTRLADLARLIQHPPEVQGIQIASLAQPIAASDAWQTQFQMDLDAVADFRRFWGKEDVIDVLEIGLPTGDVLPELVCRLKDAHLRGFLELPPALIGQSSFLKGSSMGLKLRCGGTAASAFPDDERVATFILHCRDAGLAWKATAGLHHPRRHWDDSLKVWHHGFLNVFGAGILALSHPLAKADILAILADRDGRGFRFDAAGFAWMDWTCPVEKIVDIRSQWVTSFGSCSFEEPCEDLTGLALI